VVKEVTIVTAELRNWRDDQRNGVFWGNIYSDMKGRFGDGRYIHTSRVLNVTELHNCYLVVTKYSVYVCYKKYRAQ